MATQYLGSCGHPVSKKNNQKCRACYYKRGPDETHKKIVHIGECGHVVQRADSKRCKACYVERGSDPEAVKKYTARICGHPCSKGGWDYCRKCYIDLGAQELASRPKATVPVDYDDALKMWRQVIGCTNRDYQGPATRRQSSTQRIAICSDLHAPFHHTEALAAFIEREKGSDVCIVAGDLQDHYSISRFLKYENVPIQSELAAAQMILERLSEAFPIVLVIEGNHDKARFEKLLLERLPMDAVEIVRYLSRTGGLSTIEAMCGQFTNVEHVKNKIDGRYDVSWYVQHGDLVVTHAEKFSRVPGSTLRSIEEWISDFEGMLQLQPWRVLAQAHTHQMGLFPYGSDKMLVETGCLCTVHGYQLAAKISGRPQRVGWVALNQTSGVTDLSSIQLYWWEKSLGKVRMGA